MGYVVGLDLGTFYIKGVLLKKDGKYTTAVAKLGRGYRQGAETVLKQLLQKEEIDRSVVMAVAVTGCGAGCIDFADQSYQEIACLARAAQHFDPEVRIVIDLGGRAGRLVHLGGDGRVDSFTESEKCASGSGRMVENIANILQIPLDEIEAVAQTADQPLAFTTGCAVFAESEAITAVANGESVANILAGCHEAVASKLSAMLHPYDTENEKMALVGGGARNTALVRTIARKTGGSMIRFPDPQTAVALGAAYLLRSNN